MAFFSLHTKNNARVFTITLSLEVRKLKEWQRELHDLLKLKKSDTLFSDIPILHTLPSDELHQEKSISLVLQKGESVDFSSFFIVLQSLHAYAHAQGMTVDITRLPQGLQHEYLKCERTHFDSSLMEVPPHFLEVLGQKFFAFWEVMQNLLSFFGYILVKTHRILKGHVQFPFSSLFHHMDQVGLRAIPIIALISFLIGMVLAYQGINQLARFGAEIYTIDFLSLGVLREIGVLLTSIVVAGRSASAYTAHMGIMVLNQEIDAMKVFQLDPVLYLVLPRILALVIMLPLLVFLSDIFALLGGMLTTKLVINITPMQFIHHFQKSVDTTTFLVGLSKAPLFAFAIALVGCFRGMSVKKTAQSVGEMTTRSVVEAIFLVIILNAFLSLLYSYFKI